MGEFAKVTITIEQDDSVLTVVIPKADCINFNEITWPPATVDEHPIGYPLITETSFDMHLVAKYDKVTDMILSKERKPIENSGQNTAH
ncbi:hypothetical protein PQB81_gp095 [Arthrobacter phage Kardesai]|uniref:Uncharacterized protein n=1 Tax=Arthrobacter phage Kardesai TaxID=2859474 RepID=A0AAE7SSE2_9CAUD|nr:hypothetical protein PQB81_gp095 [Arthrobacter phage Kardesai]QXO13002.1 hypothetical protein SEA_KARDESAI_95 [Arthrobacter phage Kardesai]WBF79141.1 hypothetical protein SEA_HANKLY_97 [Arthrobacter phage Hankly]